MSRLNLLLLVLIVAASFGSTANCAAQTSNNAPQATISFKFSTWNTEWLACSINGPTDDELQINNVVKVIKALNSDVVALQEVGTSASYATIDTIVRRLGSEWGGNIFPTSNDNCGQNQGIIYKKAKVQFVSSLLITNGGSSYDWSSGRYPVLYNVNLLVDGTSIPVSFINIHSKAMSDATSYGRRKNASVSLKTLLDGSTYNTKNIVLLGDFNDYLTGSQCKSCGDSPYKNFVDDATNYSCLTTSLYDPNYNSPVIDNIIVSNELAAYYKTNSTLRDLTATQSISSYSSTTSDHTPISATFNFTVGTNTSTCNNLSFSETFTAGLGDFTAYNVGGTQVWSSSSSYGAMVSGYQSNTNYANEDWLISPAFDFTGYASASLAFSHAVNYAPLATDLANNHTLWVSSNYVSGAPSTAIWTKLNIPTMPAGNSWTFVNSGDIELPVSMLKAKVNFAFKYLSTTAASTWEIKNLTLDTQCGATALPNIESKSLSKVYVSGQKIIIQNPNHEITTVYDITGRVLFYSAGNESVEVPIIKSGIYIVRIGNDISKLFVQ